MRWNPKAARHREDLQFLPEAQARAPITELRPAAPVHSIDRSSCALCGIPLEAAPLRDHVLSPYGNAELEVCSSCRRAALSEGYRALSQRAKGDQPLRMGRLLSRGKGLVPGSQSCASTGLYLDGRAVPKAGAPESRPVVVRDDPGGDHPRQRPPEPGSSDSAEPREEPEEQCFETAGEVGVGPLPIDCGGERPLLLGGHAAASVNSAAISREPPITRPAAPSV